MDLNVFTFCGNMVRDPEARTTPAGKTIVEFTVANNNSGQGDHGGCNWIRCKAFGASAEWIEKLGAKGRKVTVTGRHQSRKYTNKAGAEVEAWECLVNVCQFMDLPRDNNAPERTEPAKPVASDDFDPFAGDE